MPVDPDHPAPRQKFLAWLEGRNPTQVEQLVEDLHAISDAAFAEVCELAGKLAATADPKGAVVAAQAEVEKRPVKVGAAPRAR